MIIRLGKPVILLIAVSFFFSGCFRPNATSKNEKETVIKLVYADIAWPEYDELRRKQLREFEKLHPGVKCEYLPLSLQYSSQKLQAMFEGKISPDVYTVRSGIMEEVLQGRLTDLTPYVEKNQDYFKEFNPKAMRRHYGRYYVIPVNLGAVALFYNKRLFDEAGVAYPDETWDWNTFRDAAIKLTKKDARGQPVQWGASIMALWWQFALQNGAVIWSEDGTKCLFGSPEAAESFRFYKELFTKYNVVPPPDPANKERFRKEFRGGQSAMFIGDRWRSIEFKQIDSPVKNDWGVAVLPKAYNGSRRWEYKGSFLGVSSQSKHPELAFELLKFYTRPEYTENLIKAGDSIPLRTSGGELEIFLNEEGRPRGENEVYLKMLNDKESYPREEVWSDFIPVGRQMAAMQLWYEQYSMWNSRLSAEDTVRGIAWEMDYLYRRYKVFEKLRDKIMAGKEKDK